MSWVALDIHIVAEGRCDKKNSDVGTIRHGDQLLIDGVARRNLRKLKRYFVGEIWLEIYEIFVQDPRPDHIDPVNVGACGPCPQ